MTVTETHQISRGEMRKYAGQYVAVMNGKVVASGSNLYDKAKELQKKHPAKKIAIAYIPKEDLLILTSS